MRNRREEKRRNSDPGFAMSRCTAVYISVRDCDGLNRETVNLVWSFYTKALFTDKKDISLDTEYAKTTKRKKEKSSSNSK